MYKNRQISIVIIVLSIIMLSACSKAVKNDYFFDSSVTEADYNSKVLISELKEGSLKVSIEELEKHNIGTVYILKLNQIDNLSEDRQIIGYFLVTNKVIYKINKTDNNLQLIKQGKIPKDSIIVCQDSAVKDSLKDNEAGFHSTIAVENDKILYKSYNNSTETGYYEDFTWQKNKGLIYYRSGFGAEREQIELIIKE